MDNQQKIEELRRANAGLMENIVRQELELQELVRGLSEEEFQDLARKMREENQLVKARKMEDGRRN